MSNLTRRDWRGALDVQDASNLMGVLNSMTAVARKLSSEPECTGTKWVNEHPIMVMYAEQVAWLTGNACSLNYQRAYDKCTEMAEVI